MHGRTMAATAATVIFVIVIVDVDERDVLVMRPLCLEPDDAFAEGVVVGLNTSKSSKRSKRI